MPMKFLYWILFFLAPIVVIGEGNDLQNMSVLASQYYQNKEYAKAAEMYEKLQAFNPDVAQYVVPNGFNRRVLAQAQRETFYGLHGARGYTDYPRYTPPAQAAQTNTALELTC